MVAPHSKNKKSKQGNHYNYEARVPRFNGIPDKNLYLYCLKVEAVLESQALLAAVQSDTVYNTAEKQAKAIINAGF